MNQELQKIYAERLEKDETISKILNLYKTDIPVKMAQNLLLLAYAHGVIDGIHETAAAMKGKQI